MELFALSLLFFTFSLVECKGLAAPPPPPTNNTYCQSCEYLAEAVELHGCSWVSASCVSFNICDWPLRGVESQSNIDLNCSVWESNEPEALIFRLKRPEMRIADISDELAQILEFGPFLEELHWFGMGTERVRINSLNCKITGTTLKCLALSVYLEAFIFKSL